MKVEQVRLNRAEVRKLLRGEGTYTGVRTDLESRARRIQSAAGSGFGVTSEVGPNRARAEVFTETRGARAAEAHDRALTRSVDAGRG